VTVVEIARKHGISENTHFNWKSRYAGATVSDLKRLKELDAENAKLKRMYSELALWSDFGRGRSVAFPRVRRHQRALTRTVRPVGQRDPNLDRA
jgi:transposase-like protein